MDGLNTQDLVFRTAKEEDVDSLEKIINWAYRGGKAVKGWTGEEHIFTSLQKRIDADELRKVMNQENGEVFVCVLQKADGHQILGCVNAQIKKEDESNKGYIGLLSVDPDIQSKGIGRRLMDFAEEYLASKGVTAIGLVTLDVRTELIEWYKRRGYVPNGQNHELFDWLKKYAQIDTQFMGLEKTISLK